jgi:phosphoribosylanthranilate isomerase
MAQLHGEETVEYFRRLKRSCPQQFLIKAFQSDSSLQLSTLRKYSPDAVMIDAVDARLRGGTGKVADWTAAKTIAAELPRVFLAGGLSPENVGDAIRPLTICSRHLRFAWSFAGRARAA